MIYDHGWNGAEKFLVLSLSFPISRRSLELHVACERHDVSILFEGSGGGALVCSRDSPRTSILQLDERPDGSS
jgi:hypothetical protein